MSTPIRIAIAGVGAPRTGRAPASAVSGAAVQQERGRYDGPRRAS